MHYLNNKTVLVTGACGTVGSELIRILLEEESIAPRAVRGMDNNESELFFIDHKYVHDPRASFLLADLRDASAMRDLLRGVDIVFHTAAYKHVILCERSPIEAVQNNILGVQNIVDACIANGVEKAIFTSTDKAVNPTNVMGTSKLMGERLFTAANSRQRNTDVIFASTRFGNVLGSNGSVIPIFRKQISNGGPVTVTDTQMTRFVMSIEQSARLVLDSAEIARGGEVFITKMPVISIQDLAEVMIERLRPGKNIQIEHIGAKPGEKLYEELMSDEETRRAIELDKFYAVLPAFRGLYRETEYEFDSVVSLQVEDAYVSRIEQRISKPELLQFLSDHKLLDEEESPASDLPANRYFPGDK